MHGISRFHLSKSTPNNIRSSFYSVPAASADVNGDGAVNIADVAALVNNILNKH